jgi:transcriptional regulator with XRE-family HTH domain
MKLRIKEILKEKGMSQIELAQELGMTPVALSQRMNGHLSCTTEFMEKVAQVLGVSFISLIEDDTSRVVSTFTSGERHFEIREVKS